MNSPSAQFEDISLLEEKLNSADIPKDLFRRCQALIERLTRLSGKESYSHEYDSVSRYLDWIVTLPWNKESQDNLSLTSARKVLDANHFGLDSIKERILEFISVVSLKKSKNPNDKVRAPALLLLGLVGTGKTTMAYSIAQTLSRGFGRIPMGGMGDALQLRGKARAYPDAEPGQIMKVLRRVGTKNPIILLDEIDRVTEEARADIMGVLVELLDPEQNAAFLDHFIDYPFDLSEVLFIATANNTSNIATAVMDRLEVIEMPSYNDQQKIIIGKSFLLPRALSACGLTNNDFSLDETVWEKIVRPLGFDAGMRTLDRTISGICRKIAKLKVEGKVSKVNITEANLKEYIPSW